jgi:glycogen debranching enzyme
VGRESGSYSISLDGKNQRKQVPHWAIITPLEVGLASVEYAARTLDTIRLQYLNDWGIKHTVGDDERVWTLPTAALSRAAYRYGEPELGFQMLQRIAQTLEHGSIGMFHELIPEGACFIQLWSAATFRRGVIEDLLGIQVDAGSHSLTLNPHLPPEWDSARLEDLSFGEYVVDIEVTPEGVSVRSKGTSGILKVLYGYGQRPHAELKSGDILRF